MHLKLERVWLDITASETMTMNVNILQQIKGCQDISGEILLAFDESSEIRDPRNASHLTGSVYLQILAVADNMTLMWYYEHSAAQTRQVAEFQSFQ